jgi:DNA-binding transcriptional LysR family regulator
MQAAQDASSSRMNLDRLGAFLVLAEAGSFRRAAEQLGISQPALTRQIQVLEAELGATLLRRGRPPMSLTEAGRHVLRKGAKLVADAALLRDEASQLAGGRDPAIRIGVLQSLLEGVFARSVVAWRPAWPGVALRVMGFRSPQILADVTEGRQQLGLIARQREMPGVEWRSFGEDRFVALLPPEHRLARSDRATLEELAQAGLILPPRGFGLRAAIDAAYAPLGLMPRIAAELEGIGAIIALVQAGIGASLLPHSAATGGAGVVMRPNEGAGPSRHLGAVWRADSRPHAAMMALVEAIAFALRHDAGPAPGAWAA